MIFDSTNGFNGVDVFAISEDTKGNIWIGCLNGVFVYDGTRFRQLKSDDGSPCVDARTFFEDEGGSMWIGTTNGLHVYRNEKLSRKELKRSGNDYVSPQEPYIRAIHKDKEGTMWFGSYGDGLIRLGHDSVTFMTTHQGLYDNIVSHIVEDVQGNFWMGSNRGISRVQRKELIDLSEGRIGRVNAYSYGTADGMKSVETNGGFQPSFIQDDDDNIYFPTVSGISIVAARNVRYNTIPPPVHIERIFSGDKEHDRSDVIVLSYDSAYLEIRYTALSFADPKKVIFKYQLKGLQNEWIQVKNRRNATFARIPPGEYTFHVLASNNDGVWNMTGATQKIIVLPPYWMTWWFRSLVILFFVSVGPSIFFYRVNRLKKENALHVHFAQQLIESQEQERRRIAAELHDGLGQQILVIKNRAELAKQKVSDPYKTLEQLNEIMKSAVSAIQDVRVISHGLRPVYLEQFGLTATLTTLCDQLQETSSIEWSYHIDNIDHTIQQEKEINFYRILQEGSNNILKHSSAQQASLIVRRVKDHISVMLWDDGKGFDVGSQLRSGGMGISGMQERVKTLGGTIDVQSGASGGTVIKIIIPITHHG